MKQKRELHEIWKDGKEWKIQCPKGIMTFKRKKDAEKVKEVFGKALKGNVAHL